MQLAQRNGAPKSIMDKVRDLPRRQFDSPADVMQAFGKIDEPALEFPHETWRTGPVERTGEGARMDQISSAYVRLADSVRAALEVNRPVVALESTVIAHGLPHPQNIEAALAMEATIRDEGAIPATIGLFDGRVIVGLSHDEIERIGTEEGVLKAGRRGLGVVLAQKRSAATTVSGTLACAALVGIHVFATGGIGGVHRGAAQTFDISADLAELARSPVLTVCAGIKSILDLPLTMEYLETHSVPVVGFGTDELPAFYTRSSGVPVPFRVDTADEMAAIARAQWASGLGGGILATCPIPEADALSADIFDTALKQAELEMAEQGTHGPAVTPFLLSRIAALTDGRSVAANRALLLNNAICAARFAASLSATA
ncbi:MAG TPA: pseudouridine-5'-phosphate glycosidase [Ktedonobacterales bacterium]|nr:pseudouridine-5'-phosphate glycosidase [Ktedonobacterales bacterium]